MERMEISSDYEYGDEWDWDRGDPKQRCRHGQFIGSWSGPDILCMDCEMGFDPTLNEMLSIFDKQIEEVDQYEGYLQGIIFHTLEDVSKDTVGMNFLSDLLSLIEKMKKNYMIRKSSILKKKQETYDYYIEFCDDPENDRDVLYNVHRKQIAMYMSRRFDE